MPVAGRDDDDEGMDEAPPPAAPVPATEPRIDDLVWPPPVEEGPFSLTLADKSCYYRDYVGALREGLHKPTDKTAGIFYRTDRLFDHYRDDIGLAPGGLALLVPLAQPMLPGQWPPTAPYTRDALAAAVEVSGFGKKSNLTVALNDQFFVQTDLARQITGAWAGKDLTDDDWVLLDPRLCVDLLFGEVQAVPEAVVLWHRAASASQLVFTSCHIGFAA